MKSAGGVLLIAGAVVLLWLGWSGKYQQVWEAVTSPLDGSDPPNDGERPTDPRGPCPGGRVRVVIDGTESDCFNPSDVRDATGGKCPTGYRGGTMDGKAVCVRMPSTPTGPEKCAGPRQIPETQVGIDSDGPNKCCSGEASYVHKESGRYKCATRASDRKRLANLGYTPVVTGGGEAWTERPTGVLGLRKTAKGY